MVDLILFWRKKIGSGGFYCDSVSVAAVVIVSGVHSCLNFWVLNDGGNGIYDDSDDDYIIGGGEFGKKMVM
ncbi:unnamed protein product [Arabidopsis halleri]